MQERNSYRKKCARWDFNQIVPTLGVQLQVHWNERPRLTYNGVSLHQKGQILLPNGIFLGPDGFNTLLHFFSPQLFFDFLIGNPSSFSDSPRAEHSSALWCGKRKNKKYDQCDDPQNHPSHIVFEIVVALTRSHGWGRDENGRRCCWHQRRCHRTWCFHRW